MPRKKMFLHLCRARKKSNANWDIFLFPLEIKFSKQIILRSTVKSNFTLNLLAYQYEAGNWLSNTEAEWEQRQSASDFQFVYFSVLVELTTLPDANAT